jgi:hypothetical protein
MQITTTTSQAPNLKLYREAFGPGHQVSGVVTALVERGLGHAPTAR